MWFVLASVQSAKACSVNALFYAWNWESYRTGDIGGSVLLAAVFAHWRLQHCSFFIVVLALVLETASVYICCAHAKFMSLMCKQTETKKNLECIAHTKTTDSRRLNASKFKLVCAWTIYVRKMINPFGCDIFLCFPFEYNIYILMQLEAVHFSCALRFQFCPQFAFRLSACLCEWVYLWMWTRFACGCNPFT